jgi:hypothetical protein
MFLKMGDPQDHGFQYWNGLIQDDFGGYPNFRKIPYEYIWYHEDDGKVPGKVPGKVLPFSLLFALLSSSYLRWVIAVIKSSATHPLLHHQKHNQKKTRTVSPGKVKCPNGTEFWWIVRIKPVPFIASRWTKWLHWDSSQRSVSSMNATYLSGCHSAYLSFIARINTSLPSSYMSCPTSKSMSRV